MNVILFDDLEPGADWLDLRTTVILSCPGSPIRGIWINWDRSWPVHSRAGRRVCRNSRINSSPGKAGQTFQLRMMGKMGKMSTLEAMGPREVEPEETPGLVDGYASGRASNAEHLHSRENDVTGAGSVCRRGEKGRE